MVSIVMAVYNGEKYLKEQLESIKDQSFADWKLIIRDDGSTDGTIDIIEAFAKKVTQPIVLLKNKPESTKERGAKYNFLALLEAVSDEYVMFADQDDIWMKDKIKDTLALMKQKEEQYGANMPILVHTDVEVVNENGTILQESFFVSAGLRKKITFPQLMVQNNVTGCTMMVNQSLVNGIGIIDGIYKRHVIMHDYWLALYAQFFGKLCFLDKATMKYRQHSKNSVGAKDSRRLSYLLGRFREGKSAYEKSMQASREQIKAFLNCYGQEKCSSKQRTILEEYTMLEKTGKCRRIIFYVKYGAWKKGLIRKIMQIFWG